MAGLGLHFVPMNIGEHSTDKQASHFVTNDTFVKPLAYAVPISSRAAITLLFKLHSKTYQLSTVNILQYRLQEQKIYK